MCARLDVQSGLPPFFSKHSVVAGRATAIAAYSRSLHSLHAVALGAVGEISWFEIGCANNQSQASLLLSRSMNDHAKTCNIVVDSSTNSIKITCWEKIHYPTWSGHVFAFCSNQSEFIKVTTAGWMIGFDISLTVLLNFDLFSSQMKQVQAAHADQSISSQETKLH